MRRIATLAGLVGVFVVVMFAAAVQGTPKIDPLEPQPPSGRPSDIPPPTDAPGPQPTTEPVDGTATAIIGNVLLLLGAAILILLGIVLVRALMRAWRDRPMAVRAGDDVAHDVNTVDIPQDDDAAAPVIRRGIDGALRAIDDRATPTDAIIAAWVGLEESAADAGLVRGVSETPSEFALRIITRRVGITDASHALLQLYERVRFGGYVAAESDRTAARAALELIEEGWR